MNTNLIKNHFKNIKSLEKHKIVTEENKKKDSIKFKKLEKINDNHSLTIFEKIRIIPNTIFSSFKISYLFVLSFILYYTVYEKKKSFLKIFNDTESRNIFN
jgi:hypothetical protein